MDIYTVSFNGNVLNTVPGVNLYNHEFNSLPNREIKINKLARRDKSIITSSEYSQKSIPVFLDICSGTRGNTEETITLVKSLVQAQNAPLVVMQGNEEIRYTATMNEFNITWIGVLASVTIVFIASDPIGRHVDVETMVSIIGVDTTTVSKSFVTQGSATAYPTTTIIINSVTDGTDGQINILNGGTGQGITLNEDFADGDIVEINSELMTTTLNGATIDFTGMFPQFVAGSNQLTYTDNFTDRLVDIDVKYRPRVV